MIKYPEIFKYYKSLILKDLLKLSPIHINELFKMIRPLDYSGYELSHYRLSALLLLEEGKINMDNLNVIQIRNTK